jgi:flagellar biosynthesis/type III secretory pathway protein FliH
MPLLKEHNAGAVAHEAIVLDLGDLRKQAEQLKADARAEAERIVAEARAEAERLTADADQRGYEQGYERGHAEGVQAGRAAGREEAVAATSEQFNDLHRKWSAAIEPWEAGRAEMLDEVRHSLHAFAVLFAEKVAKRTPRVEPVAVVDQVEAALQQISRPADAKVRLHPEDRPLVEEAAPGLLREIENARRIELVEDAAVERGGCIVSYGRGRIDATIDGQLDRIVETLLPDRSGISATASAPGGGEQADTPSDATQVDGDGDARAEAATEAESFDADRDNAAPESEDPAP